jgi:hypothetical protein
MTKTHDAEPRCLHFVWEFRSTFYGYVEETAAAPTSPPADSLTELDEVVALPNQINISLVDDQARNLVALQATLETPDVNVELASSGPDAGEPPDIMHPAWCANRGAASAHLGTWFHRRAGSQYAVQRADRVHHGPG